MPSSELRPRVERSLVHGLASLPPGLLRPLVGPPVRVDGQELDIQAQLLIRLATLAGQPETHELTVGEARASFRESARSLSGPEVPIARVDHLTIPGPEGPLAARLYIPQNEDEGSGLLVYFHGGGFVVCDLDTHENTCRMLARESGVRVLSAEYRWAPEHRFPAAYEDALAAFAYAVEHAGELAGEGAGVAVGGDSAGGNLAAGVCLASAARGGPAPVFQLLFYPWLDLSSKRPSYSHFGTGFFLSEASLDWYRSHYLKDPAQVRDVRCSPLLAEHFEGLPPTYIATAGFDPLRDDGGEYAQRLRQAGVPVALHLHPGAIHGFANLIAVGHLARDPLLAAAGALRVGLAAAGTD